MHLLEYKLVRRKRDGLYFSVDGGFTKDREGKAFVFHDGADIGDFLYQNGRLKRGYEFVPLTAEEVKRFEIASERICAECRQPIEEDEYVILAKAGAIFHARCWEH